MMYRVNLSADTEYYNLALRVSSIWPFTSLAAFHAAYQPLHVGGAINNSYGW